MPPLLTAPRRLSAVVALVALTALALAATAVHARPNPPARVVGETTTFTLTPAVMGRLDAWGVKLGVVAPATHTGAATATFPITAIRGPVQRLRGVIRHDGALTISRGERTATLRNIVIVANGRRGFATAKVGHRRVRVFRLTGPKRSVEGSKVSLTVDLRLTAPVARWLNRRVPGASFRPGLLLGSATIAGHLVSRTDHYEDPFEAPAPTA